MWFRKLKQTHNIILKLIIAFGSAIEGEDKPAVERNFPNWAEIASYTNRGWTNELMSDEDTKAVFDVSADWSNPRY